MHINGPRVDPSIGVIKEDVWCGSGPRRMLCTVRSTACKARLVGALGTRHDVACIRRLHLCKRKGFVGTVDGESQHYENAAGLEWLPELTHVPCADPVCFYTTQYH